jgi:hypothetical protein
MSEASRIPHGSKEIGPTQEELKPNLLFSTDIPIKRLGVGVVHGAGLWMIVIATGVTAPLVRAYRSGEKGCSHGRHEMATVA